MGNISEKVKDSYNKIAYKYYDALWSDMPYNKQIDKFLSLLCGKIILDLGCGIGSFTKYIADKGYVVEGIDFSKNMISIAKEKVNNANFIEMDINNLKINKKYDGIMSINSIIHIEKKEIKKVLKSIYNILKDEGIFFLIIQEGVGEKYVKDPLDEEVSEFVSFYNEEEIKNIFLSSGFKIAFGDKILNEADFELGNSQLVYYLKKENV